MFQEVDVRDRKAYTVSECNAWQTEEKLGFDIPKHAYVSLDKEAHRRLQQLPSVEIACISPLRCSEIVSGQVNLRGLRTKHALRIKAKRNYMFLIPKLQRQG